MYAGMIKIDPAPPQASLVLPAAEGHDAMRDRAGFGGGESHSQAHLPALMVSSPARAHSLERSPQSKIWAIE